jgi:hypothetical protein
VEQTQLTSAHQEYPDCHALTADGTTDDRAASAIVELAEICSAQRGFDDGDPGSSDRGNRRAHRRAADQAPRTGQRAASPMFMLFRQARGALAAR